ncbi:MAG: leucine--tRNA ligase [Phycisphaerales bacterium]|nr:MAG: leucine--tRNA ligase [Phycisphaerales bacterium]
MSTTRQTDEKRTPRAAGAYDHRAIEAKWQAYWDRQQTFRTLNPGEPGFDASRPKYYVLDFFPYPSGAGLHVGHPLGYCATDIVARYKRMRGFNVLHPMGFDAFGLPAEQYAIQTNVHPAITTRANIDTYRRQLKMLGFSYDWSRELATCFPDYYKFTQWCFARMFEAWYDEACAWPGPDGRRVVGRARPVAELEQQLSSGAWSVDATLGIVRAPAADGNRAWSELSPAEQREFINRRRLAYIDEIPVNWCPALGTVLANEEVDNQGRSERGGHPVYRRPLRQWMMRITEYAERLLADLEDLDWPEPIKLMQRNWIGRSTGAEVVFPLAGAFSWQDGRWRTRDGRPIVGRELYFHQDVIRIYTTRPDTLFGATYMVLAPEHPLVARVTTPEHRPAVDRYVETARHRSDLERTAETRLKTGVFTGGFAINPVNGERIPVWVADYVLMGYGTGAIMAVPGHDTRDFEFAKQFDLPIIAVVRPPDAWIHEQITTRGVDEDYCRRTGRARLPEQLLNSASAAAGIIGGITAQDATAVLDGDAGWVNQVAWPVYAAGPGIFHEAYCGDGVGLNSGRFDGLPTPEFKERIVGWLEEQGLGRGAVNYKLRDWIFSRQKYWGEPFPVLHGEDGETIAVPDDELPVELPQMENFRPTPVADDEHTVPAPPLARAKEWVSVTRGGKTWTRDANTMPQWAGSCWYYLRFIDPHNEHRFCGAEAEKYWSPVDLYVGGAEHAVLHLLYARFWHKALYDLGYVCRAEPFAKLFNQGMIQAFAYRNARGSLIGPDRVAHRGEDQFFDSQTGEPLTRIVAKMSKALNNVVNPDEIVSAFGADTFRLYEMYMGPLDASKPWNTQDVPGLYKLCNRIWRLVVDVDTGELSPALTDDAPDEAALRLLHKAIRKVGADIEALKFNTAIAAFFDFVNGVTRMERRPRGIIEPFVLLVTPFAPHLAEELWQRLGHSESLAYQSWPAYDEALARDPEVEIAVQVLGKIKARIMVAADADEKTLEAAALADPAVREAIRGKTVRKVIVVKGRLVNVVAS